MSLHNIGVAVITAARLAAAGATYAVASAYVEVVIHLLNRYARVRNRAKRINSRLWGFRSASWTRIIRVPSTRKEKTVSRSETKYVLVRHSAFGYAHDSVFRYGVEPRAVSGKSLEKALAVGATVYDSYIEADRAGMALMYPANYTGMTPIADRVGHFVALKVDGLEVFVQHRIPASVTAEAA